MADVASKQQTTALILSTIVKRTRRRTELTKEKPTNLLGNLCCAREYSVQFFVQFFQQLNCTVSIEECMGPFRPNILPVSCIVLRSVRYPSSLTRNLFGICLPLDVLSVLKEMQHRKICFYFFFFCDTTLLEDNLQIAARKLNQIITEYGLTIHLYRKQNG